MVDPIDPDFHRHLLRRNKLSFSTFSNAADSGFLLVGPVAEEDSPLRTRLVLVTHTAEYQRSAGSWLAIESDRLVDRHGGFVGATVATSLLIEAVGWWDAQETPGMSYEVLRFCAAFPHVYFTFDSKLEVRAIRLQTDMDTWELASNGRWSLCEIRDNEMTKRLMLTESFLRSNGNELRDLLGRPAMSHSTRVSSAIEWGMVATICPALAQGAIDWWLRTQTGDQGQLFSVGHFTDYLDALSQAKFLLDESGRICELAVSINSVVWVRKNSQWRTASERQLSALSKYQGALPISPTRLEEVYTWWDQHAPSLPLQNAAPAELEFVRDISMTPLADDEESQEYVDQVEEYFDGVRYWLAEEHFWRVGPESMWAEILEESIP